MSVEIGDIAPDFELKDQTGQPVRLSDYRGKKAVVLVFYPLTFSGVCEGELCGIRDSIDAFRNDDVETLAVSIDSPPVAPAVGSGAGLRLPAAERLLAARRRRTHLRRVRGDARHRGPRDVRDRPRRRGGLHRPQPHPRGARPREVARWRSRRSAPPDRHRPSPMSGPTRQPVTPASRPRRGRARRSRNAATTPGARAARSAAGPRTTGRRRTPRTPARARRSTPVASSVTSM